MRQTQTSNLGPKTLCTATMGKPKKKKAKAVPLAPPKLKSRRKARKVTTQFHRLTRARDAAEQDGRVEEVARIDRELEAMGGREEYQRASQVSTSFFSTSKWVLGYLSRNGMLHGVHEEGSEEKRHTRLLEVGAINTELLVAAKKTRFDARTNQTVPMHRLDVKAIDIHSMHPDIEEVDFLTMSVQRNVNDRYDVIVCSMVLNCVTSAGKRGDMLCRLYHFLRPKGLCFFTIPRSCLVMSPFIDQNEFESMLRFIGFEILEMKNSPKISFFILRRETQKSSSTNHFNKEHKPQSNKNSGRYQTDFSIALTDEALNGKGIAFR